MTTKIYPSDDATIREFYPTTNYGSATRLDVDSSTGNADEHSLIDFDLSSLDKYEFVSAYVNLYAIPLAVGNRSVGYNIITSSWDESTVTWNTKPTYSLTVYDRFTVYDNDTEGIFPASAYVHGVIGNGDSNYGFALHDVEIGASESSIQFVSKESSPYPYLEVTTFEDVGYYVSGTVDIPLTGSFICGNGEGDMNNYNTTSGDVYVAFQLPWADTYGSYQTYAYNDTNEWSTTGTGYTEYFRVQYDSLWLIDGEYYVARFNYEWERVYDTGYWVSQDGDDGNSGLSKTHPWKTITYSNSRIPNDSILNIRYGAYASETDIEPTSTNVKYKITHFDNSAYSYNSSSFVSGSTFGHIGDMGVPTVGSRAYDGRTLLSVDHVATSTGTLSKVWIGARNSEGSTFRFKLKIFRIDGSYYDHVYTSSEYERDNGIHQIDTNISVQSGDIIGVYFTSTNQNVLIYCIDDGSVTHHPKYITGDIQTDTLQSSFITDIGTTHICLYGRIT